MGAISGREGYVYAGLDDGTTATSILANIDTWTFDLGAEALETTSFGYGTAPISVRTFMPGLKSGTGTITGNYDNTDTHQDYLINALADGSAPTSLQVKLYVTSLHYFTLQTVLTGLSIGSSTAGKATFSTNFQATGTMTYT